MHSPALPEADEASIVSIEVEGTVLDASPEAVAQAVEGHVGDLGYRVRLAAPTDVATSGSPQMLIVLRAAADGAWEVEFRRGDAPAWTRRLPSDADVDLRLEGLGVIVRGILVDAPASQTPHTPHRPAAPEPEAGPSEDAEPRPEAVRVEPGPSVPEPRHRVRLSLSYRADSFVQRVHHGVAAGLGWEHAAGPMLQADFAWTPPQVSEDLRIQRIPLQLGLGWRFRRSTRFQPAVSGGVTLEALGWNGAPAGTRAAPGWTTRAAAFVAVEAAFTFTKQIFAFARVTGRGWFQDALLLRRDATGAESILLRPSRLSGAGLVGFGFRFAVGGPHPEPKP